jgi:hypothetical protein
MADRQLEHTAGCGRQMSWFWFFLAFALMAVFLLWQEHRAHSVAVVPYLILLSCPLIHLFMHRRHRQRGDRRGDSQPGFTGNPHLNPIHLASNVVIRAA